MASPVLEGERLTMRFGGLVAMAEVSFKLTQGEILGVIGPNGAGKSTLFNIISGLYVPSSGEVRLEGQRLNGVPAHTIVKRGVARTFQSSRLFGDLSVLDNVVIGRHTHTHCGVFDAIFRRSRAKRGAETSGGLRGASSKDRFTQPVRAASSPRRGTAPGGPSPPRDCARPGERTEGAAARRAVLRHGRRRHRRPDG